MLEIQSFQLDQLNALIQERSGLHIDAHRLPSVVTALQEAGMTHFNSTMTQLASSAIDTPLWQMLMNAITIGETYFFRNKNHLDALQYHILPPLIQQRAATEQKFLRIWSSGCATGEEPYSIAMLLRDMIPDIDSWLITILATDINAASLENAEHGIYTANSFRGETRPTIKDQWFTPQGSRFQLSPIIRRMVNFKLLNLISEDYPSHATGTMNMDVVLCRNVTIYFTKSETIRVVNRLYQAINPGGWLIVGHSEPQPSVYDAFKMMTFENAIFYWKSMPENLIQVQTAPSYAPVPVNASPALPSIMAVAVPESAPYNTIFQIKTAVDAEHWDIALSLLIQHEIELRMNPYAYYLRAVIYLHTGYKDSALAVLRQALYCDSEFILAHLLLGDCHNERKQTNDAQRHWRLARDAMTGLDESAIVPFTDDITVEMLRGLLAFRLKGEANALQ